MQSIFFYTQCYEADMSSFIPWHEMFMTLHADVARSVLCQVFCFARHACNVMLNASPMDRRTQEDV